LVLRRAGIEDASAVVAGTTVDIDNLAITLAARGLNKKAFIVARQTQRRNAVVFRAAPADLVMLSGYVVAAEVLRVIRAPQLANFLRLARDQDEAWSAALLQRLRLHIGAEVVESWSLGVSAATAPALRHAQDRGQTVTLGGLLALAQSPDAPVHAVALLLQRDHERLLLPEAQTVLQDGDRVLFCGRAQTRSFMRFIVSSHTLPVLDSPVAVNPVPEAH
jgi:Trk K+ transport system NAD-binding subunit